MATFVKLTELYLDGGEKSQPVWVNPAHVVHLSPAKRGTYLHYAGGVNGSRLLHVLEEPAKVLQLLTGQTERRIPAAAAVQLPEGTPAAARPVAPGAPLCPRCGQSATLIEWERQGRPQSAWKCQTCNAWLPKQGSRRAA